MGPGGDAERVITIVQFEGESLASNTSCIDISIFEDFIMEPTEVFFLGLFPRFGTTIDPGRMISIVNILNRKKYL